MLLNKYALADALHVITESKSRAVIKAALAALGEARRNLEEEVSRLREGSEALESKT